ncbi:ester cyclase [Amycolatopsis sp. NPDC051371]|uniref:ester cyclase n=1 Tax=Amycolatopsis sp. NPDC051371 TaxID=3155800 RepID=UPI00341B7A9F
MTTGPDGARAFFEREMGDEVDPGHVYLAQADPAFLSAYQQFANVLYGRDDAAFPAATRKLLVIVLPAATGDWPEFRVHLRRCLRDGLQVPQILQGLEIAANATGMSAVVHGARILQEELGSVNLAGNGDAGDQVARNIEMFRRLQHDVIVGGRLDLVEQIFAPTFVTLRVGLADLMAATGGREGAPGGAVYESFRSGLAAMNAVLSDQERTIEAIDGAGDAVWAKWHIDATHAGTFLGQPATGKRVGWTAVAVLRFDDDNCIAEGWFLADELNLAKQLGLTLR